MNKKLMAVAVAGALGAPALAFAQASTVQVYGTINYATEQRSAGGGDGSATGTSSVRPVLGTGAAVAVGGAYTTAPANVGNRSATAGSGSNFGLRGREDLGGGFYSGFQIEVSIQGDAVGQVSTTGNGTYATYRNTGVWLGTGVGEVGFGMWDSPYTLNTAQVGAHSVYVNSSSSSTAAILGGLSFSQATYSGQPLAQVCNSATTGGYIASAATCFSGGTSFNRRVPNSIWYQSPDWSGFKVRAQYGTSNANDALADNVPAGSPGPTKSSLFSIAGTYANGPLYVGVGYEKHWDMSATGMRIFSPTANLVLGGTQAAGTLATFNTVNMTGSNDYGWNINGRYTFGGGFSAGLLYEHLSYSWSYDGTGTAGTPGGLVGTGGLAASNVRDLERNAYRIDGAFQTGPHTIGLTYTKSQDISGTLQANSFNGADTNLYSWVLGYGYSFSKRTSLTAYWNQVTNATNAKSTGTTFNGQAPATGGDPRYYGIGIKHLF